MRRVVPDPETLRQRGVTILNHSEPFSTLVNTSITLHAPTESLLRSSTFVTAPDRAWAESLSRSSSQITLRDSRPCPKAWETKGRPGHSALARMTSHP